MSVDTPQHAVTLLIQGVQLAQQRGAFQLEEASVLSSAVNFLTGGPELDDLKTNEEESVVTEEEDTETEETDTTEDD